jgi:F-type H+-transporting ATPase subunit a
MGALCLTGCLAAMPLRAQDAALQEADARMTEAEQKAEEKVDAKGIVLDHIRDSYEWHLTTWGQTHVSIPLPVIVHSGETGWHVFSSARLHHGEGSYEGFHIAQECEYQGKIVEVTASGEEVRPFDLSITKTVLGLLINSALVVALILYTSRWYARRKPEDEAPRGLVGMMEMLIMSIENEVIKTCVGPDYKRFSPYLLTAFFFIFVNNLMGLIPIFPGGANVTGNIAITAVLAVCTMIAVNVFGTKGYWKETLWPEVPTWLKAPIPLMPAIELFGVFTKPFALMIRLFANIMAGHSVILALTSVIFVTASMGAAVSASMTAVSVLFCIFMNCVEVLVAFIQAYVFTMLSAVFIGLSRVKEHEA